MIRNLVQNLGVFLVPQLVISLVTVALVAGYLVAWFRKELEPGMAPWNQSLDPLASVACSVGLLGSVAGFIAAFGSFQNGIDVRQLTQGLAVAYYTTGVGIFTSLIATLGCWVLGIVAGGRAEPCTPSRSCR